MTAHETHIAMSGERDKSESADKREIKTERNECVRVPYERHTLGHSSDVCMCDIECHVGAHSLQHSLVVTSRRKLQSQVTRSKRMVRRPFYHIHNHIRKVGRHKMINNYNSIRKSECHINNN